MPGELACEGRGFPGAAWAATRHRHDVAPMQPVAPDQRLELMHRPGGRLGDMRLPEFATLVERRSRHVDAMIDDVLVWRHFLVQVTGHELDRHWCNMAWPGSVKTTAVPD